MHLTLDDARRYWGASLCTRPAESPAQVLARSGWIRTLGGAAAYLGLAARAAGVDVATVDAAVASRDVQVLPTVRGCIYLVPAEDAGLSLWVAHKLSAKRIAREMDKLSVDDSELDALGVAVLEAVSAGPVTTTGLRKRLPDGAIRSLGAAGKKIGVTSTLPPALRRLEFRGQLVRQPVNDRLDSERYAWAIPTHNPTEGFDPSDNAGLRALADRYLRWAGPATRKGFAAWSGLSQTDAKFGLAGIGAVEVEVEVLGTCFLTPRQLDAGPPPIEAPPRIAWLPAMDGLFALRDNCRVIVDPAGHDVAIATFGGRAGAKTLGDAKIPLSRTLALGGRIVGLWEVNPTTLRVEARRFGAVPTAATLHMAKDAAAIESCFAKLGHGRAFGLDKDARLLARLDKVRAVTPVD